MRNKKIGHKCLITPSLASPTKKVPQQEERWRQTSEIAHAYLEKIYQRMKKWTDLKRMPLEFQVGPEKL